MNHNYRIAVLKGDGIGPEIVDQALKVLYAVAKKSDLTFEFYEALIGGAAIDAVGVPFPKETEDLCHACKATLLGAVGGSKWDALPPEIRPEKGLLNMRASLGVYCNLRPVRLYAPLAEASPLKKEIIGNDLDLMIVRELTGGIYFGERGLIGEGEDRAAYDIEKYSVKEIKRVARQAFELAGQRKHKLTLVDKANVLLSSRLWREVVQEMSTEYSDIELQMMYVDNAAMQLVLNPKQFDIILTSNIFGDILSDEASILTGSIGMLPSASLGDSGLGLYEPAHGSAPDIAGQNKANPLATILSAAMLLRHSFFLHQEAAMIEEAVKKVVDSGLRTADINFAHGPSVGTQEMGNAVVSVLKTT